MKSGKYLLLIGGLFLGLFLGGLIFGNDHSSIKIGFDNPNPIPRIGSRFPGFTLPDIHGNSVDSETFHGKPLVINFWATWCAPCKLEMPLLADIHRNYKGKLSLVAINFEENNQIASKFLLTNNFDLPVLLDESGTITNSFGVRAFPVTFFIDENGIIQFIYVGMMDEELIRENLMKIGIIE
jgi:thiol-disulfide isomerase/thioredoxin